MEVEATPALEAQRKAHPELAEQLDKIQQYVNGKLYHQLTNAILEYIAAPALTAESAAAELLEFFSSFIKPYESKFDKVRFVQILAIVSKLQPADKALDLINPFETSFAGHRDSTFLWKILKAEKLINGGQTDAAKELLDSLGKDIDAAYEVDALIQSELHKTNAKLWKILGRWPEFYKSSILYLAFTPLAKIPKEDRPRLAFEVGVASLVAEEEFNFGELMQQELLASLEGSPQAWLKELLEAFGEGKFELFDAAMAKHRAQIDATPELKSAEESVLKPKIRALALLELAFRKPKKQRRLSFDEIAQHCRVGPKDVEHLVMKCMCANLIRGKISEVEELVCVTWVKPRILDNLRIEMLRQRVDAWQKQTGLLLEHLEEMTPELLVS